MAIYEEKLIDNEKSTEEKLRDVINVAKNAQIKKSIHSIDYDTKQGWVTFGMYDKSNPDIENLQDPIVEPIIKAIKSKIPYKTIIRKTGKTTFTVWIKS